MIDLKTGLHAQIISQLSAGAPRPSCACSITLMPWQRHGQIGKKIKSAPATEVYTPTIFPKTFYHHSSMADSHEWRLRAALGAPKPPPASASECAARGGSRRTWAGRPPRSVVEGGNDRCWPSVQRRRREEVVAAGFVRLNGGRHLHSFHFFPARLT